MPIRKQTSARLVKRNITHDSISREVVAAITNPTSLAIYTYLLTKPSSWTVRRTDIINHFDGLGRARYDAAMKQLKALGLVWVAKVQGEDGRFIGNEIIIEQTLEPNCTKTDLRENPTVGKSDHIEIEILPREEDIGVRGWDEWVEFRASKKKKLSPMAAKKQIALLKEYNPDEQMNIINQSIMNDWQGLFPPKGQRNGNTQQAKQPINQGGRQTPAERVDAARERARRIQAGEHSH